MLLVIDVGNTCISLGLCSEGKIQSAAKFAHKNTGKDYLTSVFHSLYKEINFENCIISSVNDELTGIVHQAVYDTYKINAMILNTDFETDIKLKVKNPETLGSDRLANIYAAKVLYKKTPLIVIDSGSATTFDILDKEGDFIGGVIMPGFGMQLSALTEKTSKLPPIDIEGYKKAQKIICAGTKNEILSGVIRGHVFAIEGLLQKCKEELGAKPFVILSGGGAPILKKYMQEKNYNVINENLTLEGIRLLYERNI